MKNSLLFIIFGFFGLFGQVLSAQSDSLTVQTQYGAVQGFVQGEVTAFLGIPYAKPPVEDLRWRQPIEPEHWGDILICDEFSPVCPQITYAQGSDDDIVITGEEDCLYLNVWTPSTNAEALPVLFFIHGGGNQQGSASTKNGGAEMFNGKLLAKRYNCVVVTINYRLGPLGFLVHPALEALSETGKAGNYGIYDQLLALRWVQGNIAQFGGDPEKVLIFGESAGAVDASNLITIPAASGLFHAAIIQSGSPASRSYEARSSEGIAYADSLGCPDGDPSEQLTWLTSLSADTLVSLLSDPTEGGIISNDWGVTVDGALLPKDPYDILKNGEHNHVPVIVGSNADESSLMAPPVVTEGIYKTFVAVVVPPQYYSEALELYPPGDTDEQAREAFVQFLTDLYFTVGNRKMARLLSENQDEPVYQYFFDHTMNGELSAQGAYHGMELFYIFHTLEESLYGRFGNYSEADSIVQFAMGGYWTNFAASGNPNGDGLATWNEFEEGAEYYLTINTEFSTESFLRKEKLDFWERVKDSHTSVDNNHHQVTKYELYQNYPNPFNPSTTIQYALPDAGNVHLSVYNIMGEKVATLIDEYQQTGHHDVTWNAENYPSGIYFYKIEAGEYREVRKMILMK